MGLPSLLHALIADFGLNHGQFCTMGVAWSMVVGRSGIFQQVLGVLLSLLEHLLDEGLVKMLAMLGTVVEFLGVMLAVSLKVASLHSVLTDWVSNPSSMSSFS